MVEASSPTGGGIASLAARSRARLSSKRRQAPLALSVRASRRARCLWLVHGGIRFALPRFGTEHFNSGKPFATSAKMPKSSPHVLSVIETLPLLPPQTVNLKSSQKTLRPALVPIVDARAGLGFCGHLTCEGCFTCLLVCDVLEEGFGDGAIEALVLVSQQNGGVVRLAHQHAIDGLVEADEFAVYEIARLAAFGVARQIDLNDVARIGDDGAREQRVRSPLKSGATSGPPAESA